MSTVNDNYVFNVSHTSEEYTHTQLITCSIGRILEFLIGTLVQRVITLQNMDQTHKTRVARTIYWHFIKVLVLVVFAL